MVMMQCSPGMERYLAGLQEGLEAAMAVAEKARAAGIDPRTTVEIPVASDLADRVDPDKLPPGTR